MQIREVSVRYVRSSVPLKRGEPYRSSLQIFEAFKDLFLEPVEVFRVLYLDGKNRLLFFQDVHRGTLSSSLCHPREIFWSAVYHRSAGIICLHNHPSGDPEPSVDDQQITKRLKETGELLGIKLLDHLIIGEERYFSFADSAW